MIFSTTHLSAHLKRQTLKPIVGIATLFICFLLLGNQMKAQYSVTGLPFSYSNNFNSLNATSLATFQSTIASTNVLSNVTTSTSGWTSTSTVYNGRGTGTGNAGGNWSFGPNPTGDYSLGVLRSGGTGEITIRVNFTNNTGATITTLLIAWDYRQFRFQNTSAFNCTGTGALASNTTLNGKDFTGTATGTSGATTAVAPFALTGLSIANGASFGISWVTTDVTGSDNGLAIDNFRIGTPAISTTGTLSALSTTYGTASSNTTFNVSGANMAAGILVTPPAGFEVSLSAGSGFASTVTVGAAGTIASTPVYVRLAATTAPGSYSGNIVLSSSGATSVNVATVSSTVSTKALTITSPAVTPKEYDRTNAAVITGTLTGAVNGDILSLNGTGTFAIVTVGSGIGVTSTSTVSGTNANRYTLTQPTGLTGNITAKVLNLTSATVTSKTYDQTTDATIGGLLPGIIDPDFVALNGTGTFASANAGTGIVVTSTSTLVGTDAENYTLVQPTGLTGTITQKELTLTGAAVTTKVYDGTTAAAITGTLDGIISPDVVTLVGTGNFAVADAGTGIAVTSTSTLDGAQSPNYSLTQPTGLTGEITQANQTITFGTLADATYGDANFNLTATSDAGLTVSYSSSNTAVATVSGNTVTIVGVGSTNITASQVGNINYTAAADVIQSLTVNPKALTIAGAAVTTKPYDGNTNATITGTLTGIVGSDDVSFNGTGTFATADAGTGIAVTSTSTLTGTSASNYTLTQPTGLTGTITQLSQTITFNALADVTYGDGAFNVTATATSGGTVTYVSSNTSVATISGNTVTIVGAGTADITASQAGTTNYTAAADVVQSLTVNPKSLTVDNAAVVTKVYNGNTAATITGDLVGVINADDVVLVGTGTFASANAALGISVTSTSTLSGTKAGNYTLVQPTGLFGSITQAENFITFNALSPATYGDANFNLSATATSGTVQYSSSNTAVATISGNVVTIVGVGSTDITATQNGNTNFQAADPVVQTLTVNAKALTISGAAVTTKVYDGNTDAAITGTLTEIVGLDDVSFMGTGTFANADAGTGIAVTSTITLTGADASNYTLTQPTGLTGTITQASQTITFNTLSDKTLGDAPFNLTATASSGLPVSYSSSNTSVATILGNTVTIVGTGSAIITASQAGNTNYSAAADVLQTQVVNCFVPATPTVGVVNNCDGTSTLTASGYTGTLLWSTGATTATITVSAAGTYTVTQTITGCESAAGSGVAAPKSTSSSTTNVTRCSNQLPYVFNGTSYNAAGTYTFTTTNAAGCDSIATLNLTVNNTTSSLNEVRVCSNSLPYVWNGTSYNASGIYTFNTTNAAGCDSVATLLLTVDNLVVLPAITGDAIICPSSSTTYSNTVAGGVWSSSNTTVATIDASTGEINGLVGGTSIITYTYTNGSCVSTITKTITVNNAPVITLSTQTNVSCFGDNNGAFTVTASGGSGSGYLFSLDGGPTQASGSFPNLTAGSYSVVLTDAIGCSASSIITITQPQILSIQIVPPVITCVGQTVPVIVNTTGGTTPYVVNGSFNSTTNQYNYIVTDANGCVAEDSLIVNVPVAQPAPDTVRGPLNVCEYIGNGSIATYNIDPVAGADSYQWTMPVGATLVSGQGTTEITVTYGPTYNNGFITVASVTNACGVSPLFYSINVRGYRPNLPTIAEGPVGNVCAYIGTPVTYSVEPASGAISYLWSVPVGASIVSGQGTTSISVLFSASFRSGSIRVRSVANCGQSLDRSVSVSRFVPATPAGISGPVDVCSQLDPLEVTYSVPPVDLTSTYNWTVPANATIVDGLGTNSISVRFASNFTIGNIQVQSVAACGTSATRSLSVAKRVPTTPGVITGLADVCSVIGSSTTYSISNVTYASSYNWTVPANATIVSGQGTTSITVAFNNAFVSGSITVNAVAVCGTSAARAISVKRVLPVVPGVITGATDVCNSIEQDITYSIAPVNLATGYAWSVPVSGTIVSGQGTNNLVVRFSNSFTSGSVTVAATRSCGSSSARSLAVKKILPTTPTAITGPTNVCTFVSGGTAASYSVPPVANADSYNWNVPNGATIVTGSGTNAITLQYAGGFVSGTIPVSAVRACGASGFRNLPVSTVPVRPGTITASAPACANATVVYSVAAVNGATSYNWVVPASAVIISGSGTNSITVTYNATFVSGLVRVSASNACGTSALANLSISNTCGGKIAQSGLELEKVQPTTVETLSMNIFPNPTSGQFNIDIKKPGVMNKVLVEVRNEFGQLVYSQQAAKSVSGVLAVSVQQPLTPGLYIVTCTIDGVRISKKLVVNR